MISLNNYLNLSEGLLPKSDSIELKFNAIKTKLVEPLFGPDDKTSYELYTKNNKVVIDFKSFNEGYIIIKKIKSSDFKQYINWFDEIEIAGSYNRDVYIEFSELDSEFINKLFDILTRPTSSKFKLFGVRFQSCKFINNTININYNSNLSSCYCSFRFANCSNRLIIQSDSRKEMVINSLSMEGSYEYIEISNTRIGELYMDGFNNAKYEKLVLNDVEITNYLSITADVKDFEIIHSISKSKITMDSDAFESSHGYIETLKISYPNLIKPPLRYYFANNDAKYIKNLIITYDKDEKMMDNIYAPVYCNCLDNNYIQKMNIINTRRNGYHYKYIYILK